MRRDRPRDPLSAVLWGLLFLAVLASASAIAAGAARLAFCAARCAAQGAEVCAGDQP